MTTLATLRADLLADVNDFRLELSSQNLNVSGLTEWLDSIPGGALTLNLPDPESGLQISENTYPQTLTIYAELENVWRIGYYQQVGFAPSLLLLELTQANDTEAVTYQLTLGVDVTIGGITLGLSGTLDSGTAITFSLNSPPPVPASLTDITNALLPGLNSPFFAAVELFQDSVSYDSLTCTIDFLNAQPVTWTCDVTISDKTWTLTEGISIGQLTSGMYSHISGRSVGVVSSSQQSGRLKGVLNLDGEYEVFIDFGNDEQIEIGIIPSDLDLLPGITTLSKLIGGDSLAQTIEDGFDKIGLGSITFDQAVLGINVDTPSLEKIELGAEFEYLDVLFRVDVMLPFPHMNLSMRYGQELALSTLVHHYFGAFDYLPDVAFENFGISASFATGDYDFWIITEEDWTLPITSTASVTLNSFSLRMNKSNSGFSGELTTVVNLGGFPLDVSAQSPLAEGEGWQFKGESSGVSDIQLGTVLTDLATTFGDDGQMPTALSGFNLTITDFDTEFNTTSQDFSLDLGVQFPLLGPEVALDLSLDYTQTEESYHKDFRGTLTLSDREFDIRFSDDSTSTAFLASYQDSGGEGLSISELLDAVTETNLLSDTSWTITVKDALFGYLGGAVPTDEGGATTNTGARFLLGLDLDAGIDLSGLPLIGKFLDNDQLLRITFTPIVASADVTEGDLLELRPLAPDGVSVLPDTPQGATSTTTVLAKGINFAVTLKIGDQDLNLDLPLTFNDSSGTVEKSTTETGSNLVSSPGSAPQTADDGTKWFNIQKNFGPISFQRLGIRYDSGKLSFLLDASIALGPLSISLLGLGVSSPLSPIHPTFDLSGLAVAYSTPELELAAGLIRQRITPAIGDAYDEYDGMALFRTPNLSISAIGSYAYVNDEPSLFLYAVLDYPIGGPAFFFVTGLAAGFGYNRSLLIPDITQVANFPLVEDATSATSPLGDLSSTGIATRIGSELSRLNAYIPPTVGEYFFAVGIKFTSFKLIDSFALLSVSFGKELEIDLLGLSTAILPVPDENSNLPALAEIQLALKAVFKPTEGFLGVEAQLTPNSYYLSRDCRLTGGFAFYSWFKKQTNPSISAGEFVLSVGGYHPHFAVPEYYPTVPRLGYDWQVTDALSIKGGNYFALTPHVIMAGQSIEANWHDGSLSAWFKGSADFILYWKPFHYDANLSVDMGVKYTYHFFGTHHLSVDLSADLHIWGPKFSGKANIHLSIVDFTISFGDGGSQQPDPISWAEFKRSFLPINEQDGITIDAYSLSPTGGVVEILKTDTENDATEIWKVNPKDLVITFDSVIPLSEAPAGLALTTSVPAVGIAPMDTAYLASTVDWEVQRSGQDVSDDFILQTPTRKDLPRGLWGTGLSADLNGERFVENTLTGFEIAPAAPFVAPHTAPINQDNFSFSTSGIDAAFGWTDTPAFSADTDQSRSRIASTVRNATVASTRTSIMSALGVDQPNRFIDVHPGLENAFLETPKIASFDSVTSI